MKEADQLLELLASVLAGADQGQSASGRLGGCRIAPLMAE